MIRSIQGPKIKIATKTAIIFGINANVCSWIEVVAWKTLTAKPTAKPKPNIGAETINTTINASCPNWITKSPDMTHLRYRKLTMIERISKCQPSIITNSKILNGKEIMTGGNIIIPIDISVVATIISMTMNGTYSMNPI